MAIAADCPTPTPYAIVVHHEGERYAAWPDRVLWDQAREQIERSTEWMTLESFDEHQAIAELRHIEEGWDGEDAPIPNERALANANGVINVGELKGLWPYSVVPSIDGGVTIVYSKAGRHATIELTNSGDLVLTTWGGDIDTEVQEHRPFNGVAAHAVFHRLGRFFA